MTVPVLRLILGAAALLAEVALIVGFARRASR
jgi:hypothetical protein